MKSEQTSYEELFYALNEAAIISTSDLAGNITMVNDKFCQISGYSSDELLGNNHRIVNSGTHEKGYFAQMWEKISKGEIWVGEVCNRKKDGSIYWVNSTIIPILDKQTNKVKKYVSVRFDITAQKKLENKLTELSNKFNLKMDNFLDANDGFSQFGIQSCDDILR
ncbi:MAG: PAS domain S-box protein [Methylococcales bacterium]|nr:PAS domain S-box protein [Methylococcales bacterium]